MLKAQNIHKRYHTLDVLKGISLEIQPHQITSIVGASGAGKSTLLHILGGLDRADKGQILFNNQDFNTLSEQKLAQFRNRNMGFVFQFHNLLPEFTAYENICMPAYIGKLPPQETDQKACELVQLLGIATRKNHRPSQLSGGEQQRVSVARALINSPTIVFADEPSGNLDSKNAEELHQLFFRLRDELGQTFVIVTHNEELANQADRKIELADGQIFKDYIKN